MIRPAYLSQVPNELISAAALLLLSLPRLQARLTRAQVAILLGITEDDVTKLVSLGLLKPLGKPVPSAPKYFAAVTIEQLAQDPAWLSRITEALSAVWSEKNRNRRKLERPIATQTLRPLPAKSHNPRNEKRNGSPV